MLLASGARRTDIPIVITIIANPPEVAILPSRYPHGPHAEDVRRRLSELSAAAQPPDDFQSIDYDVPPPAPEETGYVESSALVFAEWDFAPLPSPPSYVLPPTPPDLAVLPEPWPPETAYALPVPVFVPVPIWCSPPRYETSIIFNNIHNEIVLNHTDNVATITNTRGEALSSMALRRPGFGTSVIEPRLPPAVARKVTLFPQQGLSGAAMDTREKTTTPLPTSSSLPGAGRHQLPRIDERTSAAEEIKRPRLTRQLGLCQRPRCVRRDLPKRSPLNNHFRHLTRTMGGCHREPQPPLGQMWIDRNRKRGCKISPTQRQFTGNPRQRLRRVARYGLTQRQFATCRGP
jgi:hypothetical protein